MSDLIKLPKDVNLQKFTYGRVVLVADKYGDCKTVDTVQRFMEEYSETETIGHIVGFGKHHDNDKLMIRIKTHENQEILVFPENLLIIGD